MPINKELLEQVRDHILAEPRRYDQTTFRRTSSEVPYGTAACVAGWAVLLSGINKTCDCKVPNCFVNAGDEAARLLGLDKRSADVLFDPAPETVWPAPFDVLWRSANGAQARAEVAASYLTHIIETGKVRA